MEDDFPRLRRVWKRLIRHGIMAVATAEPRKRSTPRNAPDSQPAAAQQTVAGNRLIPVLRTGWDMAAMATDKAAECQLIEANEPHPQHATRRLSPRAGVVAAVSLRRVTFGVGLMFGAAAHRSSGVLFGNCDVKGVHRGLQSQQRGRVARTVLLDGFQKLQFRKPPFRCRTTLFQHRCKSL